MSTKNDETNVKSVQESDHGQTKNNIKLTPADLDLIQSMADVNPNSSLSVCHIPFKVEHAIEKGEQLTKSDADVICTVAERNPNSALSQTGVPERAIESAKTENK